MTLELRIELPCVVAHRIVDFAVWLRYRPVAGCNKLDPKSCDPYNYATRTTTSFGVLI